MIRGPLRAVDRLEHLASMFEHARTRGRHDALALSAILDQAMVVLQDLAPDVAAARGTPYEKPVLQAALRARQVHADLVAEIGFEVASLAGELRRLTAGAEAADRYLAPSKALPSLPSNCVG
jgi:hypothetical protein